MSRAAAKTVERLLEKEISGGWGNRTSMGWFDDVFFIIWEKGLAECLANIASFANSFLLGGDRDEETEFERRYNRAKQSPVDHSARHFSTAQLTQLG